MIKKYPPIFILLFILGGIVMADLSHWPSWTFLVVCLTGCISGLILLNTERPYRAAIALLLSIMFFSSYHFAIRCYDIGPNHVASVADPARSYHIYGRVADWPDLRVDRTEFKIAVDSIVDRYARKVEGLILMKVTDTTTALQRGDRIEFYGRIYPLRAHNSRSSFDYGRYLNLKGVYGVTYLPTLLDVRLDRRNRYGLMATVDRVRDEIRNSFQRNLSADAAALASGFLIGETRDIPPETYRRFRDSGTLHLLAVSGSNVALVVLFFVFVLKPLALTPVRKSIILLGVIVLFAMLSYGEPSVVRASVMAALIIIAGLLQRKYDLNNIVAAAAAIILLVDPGQFFDVGFQLSFTIAWGLVFITPRVARLFTSVQNRWWYRWVIFPFMISVIAQVCSLGLIALYFGKIPLISPLANLVVVPMVSVAVVGVLVLLAAHLVLPVLGTLVGSWLNLILRAVLAVVNVAGGDGIPSFAVNNTTVVGTLLFYIFVGALAWSIAKKSIRKLVLLAAIIVLNIVLLINLVQFTFADNRPRIALFNIPGGVAGIIQPCPGSAADLVITSITGRAYEIDTRIIWPELSRLGIDRLDKTFVLSADYSAIDDILRVVDSSGGGALYISDLLEPAVRDVINTCALSIDTLIAVSFRGNPDPGNAGDGCYCACSKGLVFKTHNFSLTFTDRLTADHLSHETGPCREILVLGSTWQASWADLMAISDRGFDEIFCSKIVQVTPIGHSLGGQSPDRPLPDVFCDLARRGPIRVHP